MGVHLESKVLQRIAVSDRICRVFLCEGENTRVLALVSVVLDNALADLGNVQQTVQQIGSPVGVCSAVCNVVAEHAETLQRLADFVGEVANHRLRCRVCSAPVASPACVDEISGLVDVAGG